MSTQFDKIPPQALDIEKAVLGALLLEKDAIEKISLVPSDFYMIKHERIFFAIKRLHDKHKPIDSLTVVEELTAMEYLDEVGGAYEITLLVVGVSSTCNLEYHASIIKQKSIARKLISMSNEIQNMSYSPATDVGDIFEFIEKVYTDIAIGTSDSDASTIEDSLECTINYIQKLQNDANSGINTSIPTGLKELDKQLNGGFKAPDLIILGGRPSMGKTQFAVHFSKYASMSDNETLFISIEMTKIQLIIRMITEHEGIDFYRLKTGQLNNEEWQLIDDMVTKIAKYKLHIADDSQIRNLSNIKSLARKMSRKGNLKLLIIDYLQLIRTNLKFGTRDLEVGYITSELKNLCKELNIPCILLAQLNRPIKGAKVSSPKLEDLRESGNIEQDADIVIFPHRPTYYDKEAVDEEGNSWNNRGGLIIAKHREGEIGIRVLFKHDKAFKKIFDDNYIQYDTAITIEPNRNFYEPNTTDTPF